MELKKIVSVLMIWIILSAVLPVNALATGQNTEIVYFSDGSYLEIITYTLNSRASGTISGGKTYQYNNSDGVLQWKAVLDGTFTYTGSSATCTASSCNVTIYNSSWYQISCSTGKSGASATGELAMGYKVLGITTNRVPLSMTLTCDANGNLS